MTPAEKEELIELCGNWPSSHQSGCDSLFLLSLTGFEWEEGAKDEVLRSPMKAHRDVNVLAMSLANHVVIK